MAAKSLPLDLKETVIAEWRTGEFSYQQLADRHKISKAKVGQLCKGVEKDLAPIVDAKIQYLRGIDGQDRRVVDAVDGIADGKARLMGLLDTFHEKAVTKATNMLDSIDNAHEFKSLADGVDRISITAQINERHAKPTTINNTANTQNNYTQANDDDLMRELKQVRSINATIDAG